VDAAFMSLYQHEGGIHIESHRFKGAPW